MNTPYKNIRHIKLSDDDVHELVTMARAGDNAALRMLTENNILYMLKLLHPTFGSDRYDVMHDIIPEVQKNILKYDSSMGCFSGWMKGAVRFAVRKRNHCMHQKKRVHEDAEFTDMFTATMRRYYRSADVDVLQDEYEELRNEVIEEALGKLREKDAWIVQAHYLEGMKYRDMGRMLGVSYQAVQHRAQVALRVMRDELGKYAHELR